MELQKFTLVSNNICYGPCPEPDEEVEQRLTINAAGRVWFTGYLFQLGFGKHAPGRKCQMNIGKEKAQDILKLLGAYFSDDFQVIMATDVGLWDIVVTDTEGKQHKFSGSLCEDLYLGDTALSATIRQHLPIDDLFLFDGNYSEDSDEDY